MRLALYTFTLFTFLVATRAFTITSPGPAGWDKNVGRVTVTWKVDPGDPPTFSMLLRNLGPKSVVNSLAIANNVASALSALTLDLPPVPLSRTYQLLFVDVADVNRVFTTSPIFPIFETTPSTTLETVTQRTYTMSLSLPTPPGTPSVPSTSTTPVSSPTIPLSGVTSSLPSTTTIPPSTTSVASSRSDTIPGVTSGRPSSTPISGISTTESRAPTATVITPPGATFVPINGAMQWRGGVWVGVLAGLVVSLFGEMGLL